MSSDSSSDATRNSLLQRALQQNPQAWRELVDLYGPLVTAWCNRCHLDAHAAADCVQDVFTAVAVALPGFQPLRSTGSFRAWLWTITRNKVRDHLRRNAHRPKATGGSTALGNIQQLPDPFPIPAEEPTCELELRDLTSRALTQVQCEFEARTWQAFWRSVVDGIDTATVAEELRVSSAAVRQARSRILRRLREQLGDV